eukprot:13465899-Alexandrium_andersonii.AAC.1
MFDEKDSARSDGDGVGREALKHCFHRCVCSTQMHTQRQRQTGHPQVTIANTLASQTRTHLPALNCAQRRRRRWASAR